VQLLTQGLYTREDWQRLNPASMEFAVHEGVCHIFYNNGAPGSVAFDFATKKLGRSSLTARTTLVDKFSDTLFVANVGAVTDAFGGATRRTAVWRSGRQVFPAYVALAWVQVYGDQTPADPVTVRWYGDGVLRHTATVTDTRPQRLPPGRWVEHEVEVESRSGVTQVVLASSTAELQQV